MSAPGIRDAAFNIEKEKDTTMTNEEKALQELKEAFDRAVSAHGEVEARRALRSLAREQIPGQMAKPVQWDKLSPIDH